LTLGDPFETPTVGRLSDRVDAGRGTLDADDNREEIES
jgi:hypothetical protein